METQSVIIPRDKFSLAEAKAWIDRHNYKKPKVDTTKNFYRFRQEEPGLFHNYRNKKLPDGVELVLGIRRNKSTVEDRINKHLEAIMKRDS